MDAAEEAPYWDEWGQYIDGYGVYDEQGNYVYPEAAVEGVAGGQPQSPGVGVDPSWYASGEPFGDDVTAGKMICARSSRPPRPRPRRPPRALSKSPPRRGPRTVCARRGR